MKGKAIALGFCLICVLTIAVYLPQRVKGRAPGFGEARPDFPNIAAATRAQQRMNADGTIPDNALMKAKAQRDGLMAAQGESDFGPSSFTWMGPGNVGGRLRGILINPNNQNQLWVGSTSGGIWKTTNGGTSWTPVSDFMPNLVVGCMAMDPTNPSIMYTGTGEGFFETEEGSSNTAAIRGAGIFVSTDMGNTWNQLASTQSSDWYFVNRIAIDPTNPQVLLAATGTGIYRSTNSGLSWVRTSTEVCYDVEISPNDHNLVVAGIHDSPGCLYSSDNGQTWTPSTGITNSHRVELRWSKNAPATVYAAVSDLGGTLNNNPLKIWRSTDFGHTWVVRTTGSITTYSAYNSVLWVDPTNSNTLVVGTVNLYRSTDGGVNLTSTFSGVHSDHHVILEQPGFNGTTIKGLFFGGDGGIYKTTDAYGSAVTNLNNSLGVTQMYGAAMHPTANIMIAGAQDNGTNRYSGNPLVWTKNVIGGDGGFCASDPTNSNFFYGESQYLGLGRSSNGGTTYTGITSGVTDAGSLTLCNFMPFFMLDPNNANTMYACCRRLWRTTNVKSSPPTWTAVKPTIEFGDGASDGGPGQSHFAPNSPFNISTCAVAEGHPEIVYVGYNNGQVWKSTDANLATPSWTRLDAGSGMPGRWVGRICIDRNDPNRVYVAFMGWANDNIWRTTNGGTSWVNITGTGNRRIPDAPVSGFAVDRLRPGRLYAGTDLGVFSSADDGATWSTTNEGPANVPIDELSWRNDTTLIVATYGRGVYLADVSPQTQTVAASDLQVIQGKRISGNLTSTFNTDDVRFVVNPLVASGSNRGGASIQVLSNSPTSVPIELRFMVESSLGSGSASQSIELFNYTTQQFESMDTRAASTADTVVEVSVTSNASRFVDPITKAVKARFGYRQSGSSSPWSMRIDQIQWTIIY